MWAVAAILLLQLALGLGGCAALGAGRRWRRGVLFHTLGAIVFAAGATIALARAWPAFPPLERSILLSLTAMLILLWGALEQRELRSRSHPGSPGTGPFLPAAAMAALLVHSAAATWTLTLYFTRPGAPVATPIPAHWIATSLALAVASGGLLLGVCAAGLRELATRGFPSPHDEHEPLLGLGRWLGVAAVARSTAIVLSFAIALSFDPRGSSHLWTYAMPSLRMILVVRLILGVVMPLAFSRLVGRSLYEDGRRPAALHFVPAAIMALMGEILGAGLTVGLSGIAL